MKRAAGLALVLVLLAGAAIIYQLVNCTLGVTPLSAQVIPASEQPEEFRRLQEAITDRALVGTPLQASLPGSAAEYSLIVYTVALRNGGFLPAEMAEIQVSPAADDMLFYTDGSSQGIPPSVDVPAGTTRNLRCVLLTRSGAHMNPVRELFITYYIWGHPFSVKVTYG
ncbi:MAG: hypothetical protein AB9880_01425 [Christensenellales bacterium]